MKILQLSVSISALLVPVALLASDPGAPGVPNFHQVNEHVFRGGQPSDQGWPSLAHLGVKTIIDLRLKDEHPTEREAQAVEAAGMRYFNVPMHGIVAPSDEQVAKVLTLFDSTTDGSVFVHCRRGADRTGTVIACYRMIHDGWDNQKAFKEAKSLGMSWTQIGMKRYVLNFQAPTMRAASAPSFAPAAP